MENLFFDILPEPDSGEENSSKCQCPTCKSSGSCAASAAYQSGITYRDKGELIITIKRFKIWHCPHVSELIEAIGNYETASH